VFQEVVSARQVTVLCGDTAMNWDVVGLAASFFYHNFSNYIGSTHVLGAANMRNRKVRKTPSALRVLHAGRELLATNPLDHVYGMLAFPAVGGLQVMVDYSRPRLEVFRDVARACISIYKSLEFLAYVQHLKGIPDDTPSWVPVWDRPLSGLVVGFNEDGMWTADGQVPASIDPASAPSVLRVKGVLVDTVQNVLAVEIESPDSSQTSVTSPLKLWETQRSGLNTSIEVWAATLLVHHRPTANEPDEYTDSWTRGRMFATYLRRCSLGSEEASRVGPKLREYPDYPDWQHFEPEARGTCEQRVIFTTKTGYLGRGPLGMKVGDLVCILYGGPVPYVIRRSGGQYRFIGEAYIHDLMRGEAIDQLKAGILQEEVFDIV